MNISGGSKRIQFAGRWLLRFSLIVFGLFVCLLLVALLFPSFGLHVALVDSVFATLLVAVPGASLWFLGWLIEGFADSDSSKDQVRT